jgi:hypothetical protein
MSMRFFNMLHVCGVRSLSAFTMADFPKMPIIQIFILFMKQHLLEQLFLRNFTIIGFVFVTYDACLKLHKNVSLLKNTSSKIVNLLV